MKTVPAYADDPRRPSRIPQQLDLVFHGCIQTCAHQGNILDVGLRIVGGRRQFVRRFRARRWRFTAFRRFARNGRSFQRTGPFRSCKAARRPFHIGFSRRSRRRRAGHGRSCADQRRRSRRLTAGFIRRARRRGLACARRRRRNRARFPRRRAAFRGRRRADAIRACRPAIGLGALERDLLRALHAAAVLSRMIERVVVANPDPFQFAVAERHVPVHGLARDGLRTSRSRPSPPRRPLRPASGQIAAAAPCETGRRPHPRGSGRAALRRSGRSSTRGSARA